MLAEISRPVRKDAIVLPESRLVEDLGVDSLTFMELLISIENRYDIVFDDERLAIDAYQTLEDLTTYVQSKI